MKKQTQGDILREMQSAGFNVVTCGSCGSVVLTGKQHTQDSDILCSECGFKSDPCDFPDLIMDTYAPDYIDKENG